MPSILTNLPNYERNREQLESLQQRYRTAKLIKAIWKTTPLEERKNAAFLQLILSLGWLNIFEGEYSPATTIWRNNNIAAYLKSPSSKPNNLAELFYQRKKRKPKINWFNLLDENFHTGITHYYKPFRKNALIHIRKHAKEVFSIFSIITKQGAYKQRIKKAMRVLRAIPPFQAPNGSYCFLLNAISPTMACLDPAKRFPIMNDRTRRLLRNINESLDVNGALALANLIDNIPRVRNNLELDLYILWYHDEFKSIKQSTIKNIPSKTIGKKDEDSTLVRIAKQTRRMRKLHNKLTNRFQTYIQWKYEKPLEDGYDLLIPNWRNNRDLLIEAKTTSEGSTGRFQIRTAIGQLFDYQ